MEASEKKIIAESATNTLSEAYVLLLMSLGFAEAGKTIAAKVYPVLLEIGFVPPVGLEINPDDLGPRGKQLYAAIRGEEA